MFIDESNVAGVLAALAGKDQSDGGALAGEPDRICVPAAAAKAASDDEIGSAERIGADAGSAADRLHVAISELMTTDAQTTPAGDALALVGELVRERHRLDAAYLRAVAVADQLEAAEAAGAGSIQAYLKSTLGLSPGRAKADVAAAHAIHGQRSRELVATAPVEAGTLAPLGRLLSEGAVSLAHVDVGVKTLENIPGRLVRAENLERITGFLAAHAPSTTPREIRILSDRLIRGLEPDRDDHYDPQSFTRRFFTMATDITGMVHGNYQLDPAAGAQLWAILDPLCAPRPDQKDENGQVVARDDRTPGQRRADALGELIGAGSALLGPAPAGPHFGPAPGDGAAPGFGPVPGHGSVAGDALPGFGSGGDPDPWFGSGEPPAGQAGEQPGLFQLAQSGAGWAESPAGKLRLSRRQARITILTSTDQIATIRQRRTDRQFGGDGAELETFIPVNPTPSHCDQLGQVSPGTLARISCDGLFERVVLDAKGAVLDLGLAVRLASPAQRRAIAARDLGCVVPGCDRPPGWCEAHHAIWYSRGGPTDVENLVLMCAAHHSQVHAGMLEVRMFNGIPYVRPTRRGGTAAIPLGSVRHPEDQDWIRNGHFDRLKTADAAARTIVLHTGETTDRL